MFQYGASGFPTGSYNATNYWVDVVFNTTGGSDTTAADGGQQDPGGRRDRRLHRDAP